MINEIPTPDLEESKKKHYFINEIVEMKLTKYIWTGCTDVYLRDSIMTHANELIIQLIRKQGLFNIYRGHDSSAFNELVHVAYMQIERTLYKYRSQPHCRNCFNYDRPNQSILYKPAPFEFGIITPERLIKLMPKCPHCGAVLSNTTPVEPEQGLFGGNWSVLYRGMSKVFNMWSQVSRTVILAHVKKDTRDLRNTDSYTDFVTRKPISGDNQQYSKIMSEVKNYLWFNEDYCKVVDALIELSAQLDPDKNFKKKISNLANVDRKTVDNALILIRVVMKQCVDGFNHKNMRCVDEAIF